MWFIFALLSAVFAALTSILAKVGIEGVDSTLATAVRTLVVLAMSWVMVFVTNTQSGIFSIGKKSWIFLVLSGLATGASWLCYYKAIQIGEVSKVVAYRQVKCCNNTCTCVYIPSRNLYSKIRRRCCAYYGRNIGYGTLI